MLVKHQEYASDRTPLGTDVSLSDPPKLPTISTRPKNRCSPLRELTDSDHASSNAVTHRAQQRILKITDEGETPNENSRVLL